jgi:hypothetical protein
MVEAWRIVSRDHRHAALEAAEWAPRTWLMTMHGI